MKNLLIITLVFCATLLSPFNAKGASDDIKINEVSWSNKNILFDSDNDSPDWFELFNKGSKSINLAGYQVTDDTTETDYWTFPNYILKPGEYLLVFASGKNRKNTTEFHVDFKLSLMKDNLYLINQNGEIVDVVNAQCVPNNASLSSRPDGSENRIVAVPTPGKSNNQAEELVVNYIPDTLTVNKTSGFYKNKLSIKLTNNNPENVIRYTLDGDLPGDNSPVFESETKIELNDLTPNENRFANTPKTIKEPGNYIFKANILRATVFSNGCPASKTISNVYFINNEIQNKYKVPVISILTEEDNLFDKETGIYVKGNYGNYLQKGKAWERPAHVVIFDENKEKVIDQDAGLRISGQGSREFPQKPFRLYARTEYGKEFFEYPFFKQKPEIEKFRTLLLRCTQGLTGTIFKDELTQQLVSEMNIDYSGSQSSIVFVNGEYWGIYSLRERLDKGYIENNFGVNNPNPDIISHAVSQISVSDGSIEGYNELKDYLASADYASDGFFQEVSELIDIPELIDYYVAQMYFANYDFPENNLKLWKSGEEDAKWRLYFYDCDACMTNTVQDQLIEYGSELPMVQKHEEWSTLFLKSIFRNEEFRTQFHKAFIYHMQNTFNSVRVLEEIYKLENLYDPLVGEHIYRWGKPANIIEWKYSINDLKSFATHRPAIVNAQLYETFGKPYSVYPNPSNGKFSISLLNDYSDMEVKVYNMQGVLISARIIDNSERTSYSIDQPSGIYFIKLKLGNSLFTEKMILK